MQRLRIPIKLSKWGHTGVVVVAFLSTLWLSLVASLIAPCSATGLLKINDVPLVPKTPPDRAVAAAEADTVSKATAQPPRAATQPAPSTSEAFQPQELEGTDEKVAALAAHRLLQEISRRDPPGDPEKAARLNSYLLEKLSAATLAKPGEVSVVAERIVDALATWITSSGPPLEDTAAVLLPLLGVGSGTLRENVIRALQALLRHELATARSSPTLAVLTERFGRDPPPSTLFTRDAARVLWETEGKALLNILVSSLVAHSAAPPGTTAFAMAETCLEELRARIPRDFATVDGWQKWWSENREHSLEVIISSCWLRNNEEYVANWKQTIRRLRETGNAEKLLVALQDALASVYSPDLRTAAAQALGDFADWILEMRLEETSAPDGNPKDKLLRRAVQSLEPLLSRKGAYTERPAISRAALASLGKYHAFIEKNQDLLAEVTGIVTTKLVDIEPRSDAGRDQLLETYRLAGALRVEGAREHVASFLAADSQGSSDSVAGTDDLELQTAAVTALGRLAEKQGLSAEGAALLIQCFRKPRSGPEKSLRELRRACVTALGAGAETPEVRSQLYTFHSEILASGDDKDLRIPAILALGTLARQKDEKALGSLLEVLAKQESFEPQEVIAAIDSIAYVGGDTALYGFLAQVGRTTDKGVREHLLKKTAGLMLGGGAGALVKSLQRLEDLALAEDSQVYLEFALDLWQDAQIQELVTSTGQVSGRSDSIEAVWKSTLLVARAQDFLGMDDLVASTLGNLTQLLQKDPSIKDKYPQGPKDMSDFKSLIAERSAIKALLGRAGANDVDPVFKQVQALLEWRASLSDRWRNLRWVYRQLAAVTMTDRLERVREGLYRVLGSDQNKGLWTGFPQGFRERYLNRLDALKGKPRVGQPAGTSP